MEIKFVPISKQAELYVEKPAPASSVLPEWYRHLPAFESKYPTFNSSGKADRTLKLCTPFADTLKFGYIQKTWQDIKIENVESGAFNYYFPSSPMIFSLRQKTYLPKDFLTGYYESELIWQMQWIPKLPKGYSALITHPLNRDELPFKTLTGIIDADEYFHSDTANLPFLLKENFDGIIPAGTPMFQIIPFKRDDWKSSSETFKEEQHKNGHKIKSMFWGGYKKLIWKKKTFI